MNITVFMNNPYLIFMTISALCSILELILIFAGKSNDAFLKIGNLTSWVGLLFIILDYLLGKYTSLAQAMKGLSDHLLLFGEINIGLLFVFALALVFLLLFRRGADTGTIRSIFLRSTLFAAISIILRWLLTNG